MSKAGLESAALAVSFWVCSTPVAGQILDGTSDAVSKVLGSVHQVEQDIAKHVMDALRDRACGHRDAANTLHHVGTVTGHDGGTRRGPDEAFGDVCIGGVEGVQIGMRFPLFEQQLDLPT